MKHNKFETMREQFEMNWPSAISALPHIDIVGVVGTKAAVPDQANVEEKGASLANAAAQRMNLETTQKHDRAAFEAKRRAFDPRASAPCATRSSEYLLQPQQQRLQTTTG